MAKQTIAVGSSANDGTGDTLRAAGQKINSNFDELYAGEFPTIIAPNFTNDQRNALSSPVDGQIIYNTTTNKLQVLANSVWIDLH